jgi:hypothetical protein
MTDIAIVFCCSVNASTTEVDDKKPSDDEALQRAGPKGHRPPTVSYAKMAITEFSDAKQVAFGVETYQKKTCEKEKGKPARGSLDAGTLLSPEMRKRLLAAQKLQATISADEFDIGGSLRKRKYMARPPHSAFSPVPPRSARGKPAVKASVRKLRGDDSETTTQGHTEMPDDGPPSDDGQKPPPGSPQGSSPEILSSHNRKSLTLASDGSLPSSQPTKSVKLPPLSGGHKSEHVDSVKETSRLVLEHRQSGKISARMGVQKSVSYDLQEDSKRSSKAYDSKRSSKAGDSKRSSKAGDSKRSSKASSVANAQAWERKMSRRHRRAKERENLAAQSEASSCYWTQGEPGLRVQYSTTVPKGRGEPAALGSGTAVQPLAGRLGVATPCM